MTSDIVYVWLHDLCTRHRRTSTNVIHNRHSYVRHRSFAVQLTSLDSMDIHGTRCPMVDCDDRDDGVDDDCDDGDDVMNDDNDVPKTIT
jgi:hypothetical protein